VTGATVVGVGDLRPVALAGLTTATSAAGGPLVPFTLRGAPGTRGPTVVPEGRSLRYSGIVALGLSRQPLDVQRSVLGGADAASLALACLEAARASDDLGAVALALWAAAEVGAVVDAALSGRLLDGVRHARIPTVVCAWALVAGLAQAAEPVSAALADEAAALLLAHQPSHGVFPHRLPRSSGLRGHVGCFADQVYPIQALARFAAHSGDRQALAAAGRTAARMVALQGPAGQWWWHYDARTGDIAERYPVYSVHQYGMAPMALAELALAGGDDHGPAIDRGVNWLVTHPECVEPLVSSGLGVVWRKVGRRDARKAARAVGALNSRVRPHTLAPGVDRLWRADRVDYECRPYELGWLLYAAGSVHYEGNRT